MNHDNIKKWTESLRDPDLNQTQGALCVVKSDGTQSYCCLGLGSSLVPGMQVTHPDGYIAQYPTSDYEVKFGEAQVRGLAPREFIEWLGLERANDGNWMRRELDIYLDFPHHLSARGGARLRLYTCSHLNDAGFTFPQIADLIDYFGIAETGHRPTII